MNLQCPHCHTTFEVDENYYSSILAQVKNKEFEKEVEKRLAEIEEIHRAEAKNQELIVTQKNEKIINEKDKKILELDAKIESLQGKIDNYDSLKKGELDKVEAEKEKDIIELKNRKEKEISELQHQLENIKKQHEIELMNTRNLTLEELHEKEQKITELKSELSNEKITSKNKELEMQKNHEILLKAKDEEIERYRDLKSKLSVKLLGETLEQHCFNAFNMARSNGMYQEAYFDKDNDASSGSKGDFIFRDYINGEECLSIMFEMKNESDITATRHKNEDFFPKLHKDRTIKECEYAVLVSTLESDSELYNTGIVDVSYRYPKMFVVRPQFFMPLIALLSKAARRGAETLISLREELIVAKAQSIDVTNFETRRDKFAAEFIKLVEGHKKKHEDAMEAIDKAIAGAEKQIEALRKIKNLFEASTQKLVKAGETIENDFTIKKLTYGNPTMKAKFEEARRNGSE